MRILVVANDFPSPQQPGAGIFVLRQVQALTRLGHQIAVVRVVPHAPAWTPKWRAYRAIPKHDIVEGVAVETIRALFPPRMLAMEYLPLQAGPPLRRIVSHFAPDIVHAHFLIPSGQLAVAQELVPVVVTAHGSDAYDWAWRRPGLRRAATEAVARADAVVAVSGFIRRHVRALAKRDVEVVYNGADEGTFAPSSRARARSLLGIEPGRFVVAFTGGLTRAKGAFDLAEAAARVHDLQPLLILAGATVERDRLARVLESNRVDVRILGVRAQPEIARVLAAADVFCLPSYREGLPASMCEAMLSGCPIVSTPVGGIPEIVADGVNGFLVPPGDASQLAERLRTIARDPVLAARLGDAAHRFAHDRLTWRVNAQRYDGIYRRTVVNGAREERPRCRRGLSRVASSQSLLRQGDTRFLSR